jgi:Flp pilus assembly CpaE family ATPase
MTLSDLVLVVATAEPPALRGAQRLLEALDPGVRPGARLVLNQFTRAHPAHPASIAAGLQVPLLTALPTDPRAVGFHVNFGRPCALDRHSPFGRRLASAARALAAGPRTGRAAA